MPVRKFRSIDEMDQATWRQPGDPALYRAIAATWALSRRTRPKMFPRGVTRYESIEAMSCSQEQWADASSLRGVHVPTFLENGSQVVDQTLIDDVVRRIVERFHPQRIVLFGSQARGDAGPESDIDLFIEMESSLRPIDRMVAVASIFERRLWGLDVFVYTPAEVEAARGRIGNLLSYVEAEGKVLYERP